MLILPPYLNDRQIYEHCGPVERLFFNKLWVAEQAGHLCGPMLVRPPEGKKYCIRPTYNLGGNAEGGFYVWDMTKPPYIAPNNHPGFFWCEWFEGSNRFTEYTNDVPVYTIETAQTDSLPLRRDFVESTNHIPIPEFAKGLSRHLLVETIGDKIVEISFRHMGTTARQASIDDYRTIDPNYNPTDIELGINTYWVRLQAPPYLVRGYYWKDARDPILE